MYTLGIDLGKNGGMTLLCPKGQILLTKAMPKHPVDGGIDHYEVEGFLATVKGFVKDEQLKIIMEKVWGQAGSGTKQVYMFGENNGYVKGLINVWFGRDIQEVTPRTWQKWLFAKASVEEMEDAKGKRDTKGMAKEAISRLHPNSDLRATPRSKVPHDGIVDSVGIAMYGREEL